MHPITPQQSQYLAWQLTRRAASDSIESLAATLVDAQVDLNPHQVDAALFACRNPLSRGVILADEVGLGKTIEAGLVIAQRWAERRHKILIITPANLRKQWHQELQDKFGLGSIILEGKNYNVLRKNQPNPFQQEDIIICSYPFAKSKADDIRRIHWDLAVLDEAHRLRNVYKSGNITARTLKEAMTHVHAKVLLTATPLQNTLLELYGLVSIIDGRVFGDLDSFRAQFTANNRGGQALATLRARLAPVCKRTLRQQVQPYVSYTARRAIVQEFTPTAEERELSRLVADYLRRPNLQALPEGQRQLISLVLWKLLASSSRAIAGALATMAQRLQTLLDSGNSDALAQSLNEDYESLADTADEWDDDEGEAAPTSEHDAIAAEIAELKRYKALADNIRNDGKGQKLCAALDKAFAELERLGAAKKAIIFTESRRIQDYLLELLEHTPYGDGIVLFNGSNSDARAQTIYKNWLKRHAGSDRITGSKTADTRAALVEHFKERGTIMIATEAGAEGINLQFCSLVINYDLPWNPQRIEQRIGRCHRYGQKHDVVVVNFVDRGNEADARVYELLQEKFQLFEGVFGASDEVLGAIGSGVDFERRIADIYRSCRTPEEIQASFARLRQDLAGEINEAMNKTRQIVLENFDEKVQEKLRISAADSRSRYERMLLDISRAELGGCARFDKDGFTLHQLPPGITDGIALGRYELPRRTGDAHLYRNNHPLAQWLIAQAKNRRLAAARLTFDYAAYGNKISTLENRRGQSGWLTVQLISAEALGNPEQHLLVAATTRAGEVLIEDDPEKLLRLPATAQPANRPEALPAALLADIENRKAALLAEIDVRNRGYFDQEYNKLDDWAEDLKLGLERAIEDTDREISEARRTAATAATLADKLEWKKKQRELEDKRNKMRKELFDRQDEIDNQRNQLLEQLEAKLTPQVEERTLFTIEWEMI
ncbi:MAG: SNF2-related protein [Cardiobacterium sp.]